MAMSTQARKRPVKAFRVVVACGSYRVGDVIQPTGIYRDKLIALGWIKEISDDESVEIGRQSAPPHDRMVRLPEKGEGRPVLNTRGKPH
jgi:hypothetical protein